MLNESQDIYFLTFYDYFAIPAALIWFIGGIWVISVTLVRFCFIENNEVLNGHNTVF